jgi:hypothetical protein
MPVAAPPLLSIENPTVYRGETRVFAERLSARAERTGDTFRLYSSLGRPVALVFGSCLSHR